MGPIRLNGKLFTRNSVAIRVNGLFRISGVDTIDFSESQPHETVAPMNENGPPAGKAPGVYTCTATMGIYLDEALLFEAMLLADPTQLMTGLALASKNFTLGFSASEDMGIRSYRASLNSCNITDRSQSVSADGSHLVMQYTLKPTYITTNGYALINLIPSL